MKILIAILFVVIGGSVHAQQSVMELKKATSELRNENTKSEVELKKLEDQYKTADASIAALREDVVKARDTLNKSKGGIWGFFEGKNETVDRDKARLNEAQKKLDDATKAMHKTRQQMTQLKIKEIQTTAALEKSDAEFKTANEAVANILRSQGLSVKFSDIQSKIGNADQALAYVSHIYDQRTIGAYLKDKIGLLLNSRLFCEAKKRCDVPEPMKIENKRIEEVLFPGTSGSNASDYYDRANKSNK